ncbi:MAG: hypothetical protein A3G05_01680 [Candidatus Zambryskibacteria bacterium RIFCSPLOWO2_12_FULL_45_14]|uniref:Ribulose-phosphate 3-epimerase n=2 Tax=Candidatus Zambryskiibacteriota TaxID=1817925 RepID=A0A1G2ULQ3_9BACT|nr:MAG: hypothetical protein A3H60_01310 [Candidatus Zambryskibacteria bacterium RIFCSPLOWO2_02_FULL_44_12b]OHB14062.1 MAG: hypothetical protein A3G05_01680 [Candidatus Zambryskibacteria bacterium RIFCSPLOWO2_12_FULL_45_14]
MSEIIPAILATDIPDLESKLAEIPSKVKFVHIDVLEEDYWTDIGIGFEAHLMVKKPAEIIDRWITRGAKRIIVHKLGDLASRPVEIGLGVEFHTPLEEVYPFLPQVDFVHLMSIDALGTQGDDFEPGIFGRIRQVREKFPKMKIGVDGGVSKENYRRLIEAGADRLIVGSHFKDLWNLLKKK